MQVIEEFIHIVGLGMKDFHNAYLMTGNLGKNQPTALSSFFHLFVLGHCGHCALLTPCVSSPTIINLEEMARGKGGGVNLLKTNNVVVLWS